MARDKRMEKAPNYLSHKPLYVVNDYDKIDGLNKENTDVIGLSIGKAQWSGDTFTPSVKVWRDVKDKNGRYKISRESEETSLTRAVDMATFVVKLFDKLTNNKKMDKLFESSIFDELKIEKTGKEELHIELKKYYNEERLRDLKNHIKLLKQTLNKIDLEKE